MLQALAVVALSLWAVWFEAPPVATQFHQPTQDIDAQGMAWSATLPDGSCLVSVHPGDFPALPEGHQLAVMLHEVGHCLGLGHFGDCELAPAVMASCTLSAPTAADRLELVRVRGYRVVVPGVAR